MKHLYTLIFLLTLVIPSVAMGGDLRIVVNGLSKHLKSSSTVTHITCRNGIRGETFDQCMNNPNTEKEFTYKKFNETNLGIGFEYDLKDYKGFKTYINGGYLNDSFELPMFNVGLVVAKRWNITKGFHFEAGINSMVVSKNELRNGSPTPVILPVVTLGTDLVAVNITYMPMNPLSNSETSTDVLFMQLKFKVWSF